LLKKFPLPVAKILPTAVQAILKSAKHGKEGEIGDGKIFVVPLEKVYCIRTEEEGSEAI
jgi:nitrogen regulatory protein P-II 1